MNQIGRWIGIQSYKHDGTMHRSWDRGLILENNNDYLVIATKRAKVIESNGRRWFTKEPAVTIFSKKDWWNVICMLKKDGVCYYCNIASPAVLQYDHVSYIDYDLDAKLFPTGDIRVLDEKEYLTHRKTYKYSDELDTVLKFSTRTVLRRMVSHQFPFADDKIFEYYNQFNELIKK